VLRAGNPKRPASGKKRSAATLAEVTWLAKSHLAAKPLKHHRLRLSARTHRPAIRALAPLHICRPFGPIEQFVFAQLPAKLVADFSGQLLQSHERSCRSQFPLILPRQDLNHLPNSCSHTAFHCLPSLDFQRLPPTDQNPNPISTKFRAKRKVRNAPGHFRCGASILPSVPRWVMLINRYPGLALQNSPAEKRVCSTDTVLCALCAVSGGAARRSR